MRNESYVFVLSVGAICGDVKPKSWKSSNLFIGYLLKSMRLLKRLYEKSEISGSGSVPHENFF